MRFFRLTCGLLTFASMAFALTVISNLIASPGTITFNLNDPDTGAKTGDTPATVTWDFLGVELNGNWSLKVHAANTTFDGCSTIPVSAVTVACSGASMSGLGLGGSAGCNGSFPLSTTPTQVAGGIERLLLSSYVVTINYTIADSWKYIAATCPLTIIYTVSAD